MAPIHVLHGQPTPEELATVLAVVQARGGGGAPPRPPPRAGGGGRARAPGPTHPRPRAPPRRPRA
ncbi:acyl-CoA carboxylase subunit epsilon, partial [Kitasatospora sp. NPDC059722]|uniref:acyl-CoA carboxylase subunit epsilon n=1 Tax=Kitasatospora sp. NPDC059722 TaxID=3346925 RepID=UPI0036B01DBD